VAEPPAYPLPGDSPPEEAARLHQQALQLAQRDPALQGILERYGLPPYWQRPSGFAGLLRIILEQQVSLASAKAAYDRLVLLLPELTPEAFLSLSDDALRQAGFSRQKTAYSRILAAAILNGDLDLDALTLQDDETVRAALIRLKGIGHWTVDVYLLLALRRPDVWPVQDLGLIGGVQRAYGLNAPPSREELLALGERFRPYRSTATRLFWHRYLSGK
jgi:DNA-3-methyladenine glycosylase II